MFAGYSLRSRDTHFVRVGYSAVASYGTPFGRMGLDLWFDTHFVRGILGCRLVWDSLLGWFGFSYCARDQSHSFTAARLAPIRAAMKISGRLWALTL